MLISHKKEFIFIKTQKTAGTSVESFFEKYCMPDGEWTFSQGRAEYDTSTGIIGYRGPDAKIIKPYWCNHLDAKTIKSRVRDEIWEKYFKFTVIRNPYDRIVSLFCHVKRKEQFKDKNEFISQFRSFVQVPHLQSDRGMYTINDKLAVDYVIRFEDLRNGIHEVCNKLAIPFDKNRIPHLKPSAIARDIPFNELYDERRQAVMKRKFKFEIETFGYDI